MFRTSDPLQQYSQNPHEGGPRVPLVANANFQNAPFQNSPVQGASQTNSKTWMIILGSLLTCLIALLALNRQSSPTIDHDTPGMYHSDPVDWIDYRKLADISRDPEGVQAYLQDRMKALAKLNVNQDPFRSLEPYSSANNLTVIQELREKVDKLAITRKNLDRVLAEVTDLEKSLKRTHESCATKMDKVENLGNNSLITARQIVAMKNSVNQWERALNELKLNISIIDNDEQGKKDEFYRRLTSLSSLIQEKLASSGMSREEININLNRKKDRIFEIRESLASCEQENNDRRMEIDNLKRRNRTISDQLLEVEYLLKQKRYELHTLETAKRLESVLKELTSLQKVSSAKVKEYMDELVESLSSKENEYKVIAAGRNGETPEEKEKNLKSLQDAINKEKELLSIWVQDQLRSLRISKDEIGNLTMTIRELNRTIGDDRGRLEELQERSKALAESWKEIPGQIKDLQWRMQKCSEKLMNGDSELEKEQREVDRILELKKEIERISNSIEEQNEAYNQKDGGEDKVREMLERQQQEIKSKISRTNEEISQAESELKRISRQINDLMKQGPISEGIAIEAQRYNDKVRLAESAYNEIVETVNEIKRIL